MPVEYQHADQVTGKIAAVSNTGPLISVFQSGRTDLLRRYFSAIHIPESVLVELEAHGAGDQTQQLIAEGFLVVETIKPEDRLEVERWAQQIAAIAKVKDPARHQPEAEAIVLMGRMKGKATQLLLEEKAARKIAQGLRIPLTGFAGVLLQACRNAVLSADEARAALMTCRQQGTHYSESLIAEVFRRCKEVRQR
jgi:predicted nucleic acid-binding protein